MTSTATTRTSTMYDQLPGNPYLRRALDQQNTPAVRQVFATLAQAFETRTLTLQKIEVAGYERRRHHEFSTPANRNLELLREDLTRRTTHQETDDDD